MGIISFIIIQNNLLNTNFKTFIKLRISKFPKKIDHNFQINWGFRCTEKTKKNSKNCIESH
jgi:hypothetical protein